MLLIRHMLFCHTYTAGTALDDPKHALLKGTHTKETRYGA